MSSVSEPDSCFALFYFTINACISHVVITLIRPYVQFRRLEHQKSEKLPKQCCHVKPPLFILVEKGICIQRSYSTVICVGIHTKTIICTL